MKHSHCHEASNDRGKRRSDGKQDPAGPLPGLGELGSLNEDIYEVGCAIGYVCDHGEQEQTQEKVDKKNAFDEG